MKTKTQNTDLRDYKQFLRMCRLVPVRDALIGACEYPAIIRVPLSQGV